MKKKRIAAIFFLMGICLYGFSESFRVHKTILKTVTEKTKSANAELGINDALVLNLPENSLFLQGIELEIKIPAIAAEYRDAIAYALYTDISPRPAADIIDYSGQRLSIDTFPGRLSCNIRIPLIKNHTMQKNPYTIIMPSLFSKPVKTLFFRLQLVMKGVPRELFDSVFSVTIKPVLIDRGLLDLKILYPEAQKENEQQKFLVFIDERQIDFPQKTLFLDTGMHRLNIVSDHYRNEVRSFSIEQAKTSSLVIRLQDIIPLLHVSAPQNTRFFMNNTEIKDFSKPIPIEAGTHQLRFSLGDYEVVRVLEAENGRSYNISVAFDVTISEE